MEGGWEGQLQKHPATFVLLAWLNAVFSERKAFTLQSQKQGGLNKGQQQLLHYCLTHEPTGAYILALILPATEVYMLVSDETKQQFLSVALEIQSNMHKFYKSEWDKGIWKSARRQMRVLPRGSGVNSTAVNAVADALQNLRRFIVLLGGNPFTWAPLQLIANDQWRMSGGRVHPKTRVFDMLTRQGFFPWNEPSLDFVQALIKAGSDCGCSVHSWIGQVFDIREAAVTNPVDMICGVAVPNISLESVEVLKACGVFGARPWNGAAEKPPPTLEEALSSFSELLIEHEEIMKRHNAQRTIKRYWKKYSKRKFEEKLEKQMAEVKSTGMKGGGGYYWWPSKGKGKGKGKGYMPPPPPPSSLPTSIRFVAPKNVEGVDIYWVNYNGIPKRMDTIKSGKEEPNSTDLSDKNYVNTSGTCNLPDPADLSQNQKYKSWKTTTGTTWAIVPVDCRSFIEEDKDQLKIGQMK